MERIDFGGAERFVYAPDWHREPLGGAPDGVLNATRVPVADIDMDAGEVLSVGGFKVVTIRTAGGRLRVQVHLEHTWGVEFLTPDAGDAEVEELVRSIPLIRHRDRFQTTDSQPISQPVSSTELAGWLETDSPVAVVEGSGLVPLAGVKHHADVALAAGTPGRDAIMLAVMSADANRLPEVAMIVPAGQLFEFGGVPAVSGHDAAEGRSHVIWVQRDRCWHLIANTDRLSLLGLGERISTRIRGLP